MWPIAFWAFHTMHVAHKSGMFSLLAILALRDSGIHVSSIYCRNTASDIEAFVN